MTISSSHRMTTSLVLHARTAADLMTTNPQSLRQNATVAEAIAFLSTRGFSAAPVIDEAGRPLGVVSRTDLLHHHHSHKTVYLPATPPEGGGSGPDANAPVQDVMTPAVFCVRADTPAAKVVDKMLALNVRRLFVVDDKGVLVGVVSAFDVLRGFDRSIPATG